MFYADDPGLSVLARQKSKRSADVAFGGHAVGAMEVRGVKRGRRGGKKPNYAAMNEGDAISP